MIFTRPNQRGFTFIELMIVVAVIAILAIVAVPKFANLLDKAREAEVKNKLGALRGALSIYYSDTQVYPNDFNPSLTAGGRYIAEIPSFNIPPIPTQGNPGHATASAVETAALDDMATGAWHYVSHVTEGFVTVNCTHRDSRGVVWSTY